MNKTKILFLAAAVALVGFGIFLVLILTSASKDVPKEEDTVALEQESKESETEEIDPEELALQEEARTEMVRFLEQYGMEISFEEMLEQVRIRKSYEEMYGRTYDLEEVFLSEIITDPNIGDPGWDEEDEEVLLESESLIEEYVQKYGIDKNRYEGMEPLEMLEAIQIEYGSLDDETDSAYYREETSMEEGRLDEEGSGTME